MIVGYRSGEFVTEQGERIEYHRLSVLYQSDDTTGLKAEEVKVRDAQVLEMLNSALLLICTSMTKRSVFLSMKLKMLTKKH